MVMGCGSPDENGWVREEYIEGINKILGIFIQRNLTCLGMTELVKDVKLPKSTSLLLSELAEQCTYGYDDVLEAIKRAGENNYD